MGRALLVALVLSVSLTGHGQQQITEAFQSCLADNTSGKDRKDMAKWIFLAMGAHPEIRDQLGPNTAAAAEDASRRMAALVVRLLADDCVKETRAVTKGAQVTQSFQIAFARLGELAMQELMADKSVQAAIGEFEKHLDKKRLDEALIAK
jgi:hypothetical protein